MIGWGEGWACGRALSDNPPFRGEAAKGWPPGVWGLACDDGAAMDGAGGFVLVGGGDLFFGRGEGVRG